MFDVCEKDSAKSQILLKLKQKRPSPELSLSKPPTEQDQISSITKK